MKRAYWEKIAPTYGDEIFDVLHNDKKAIIRSAISQYSSPSKSVIDIGCAIGKWLPVLSPAFKKVVALDISARNLEIAKKIHSQLKNIVYIRADMSSAETNIPKCDVGICINAILTPSLKDRTTFISSLKSCIKKGGHIIITVPSLESWMLSSILQRQFKIDQQLFSGRKNAKAAVKMWNDILEGNAEIDSVPHKHFLKEELEILLTREGFSVVEFQKIEYRWSTEFVEPPGWLKKPQPWDWMLVAKKK